MLVRIKIARTFAPHLLLLGAASKALESAKTKTHGFWWDWLAAILYYSLSVEAIGNTYGKTFVPGWDDFESASPQAKIRLVAERCKLEVDFGLEPWSIVPRLIKFRNLIAHAKLKELTVTGTYPNEGCERYLYAKPESAIEAMVTEHFARRSQECITEILQLLAGNLPEDEVMQIETESWSGHAEVLES